jgi:maleate cis-trans isomerase
MGSRKTQNMEIASLREIMATRARAVFSHRINFADISHENLEKMEQWCLDNCEGLWDKHTQFALYFRFEEERDATMFMLRWGSAEGNRLR